MSIALVIGLCNTLFAVKIELGQQFSAWLALNNDKPATPRFSLRYQPTISLAKDLSQQWKLDSELSLDMHASAAAPEWKSLDIARVIKPYRLWLRLSSSRFEARLGLQKINFGSATVLRPLMWFDRIDSRDPLQLSYGVYGLLLRYYFKDNANIWLWGLYGNQDTKGWETQATADHVPEFGGRFQAPLLSGEVGLTFHHRCFDPGNDPASALNTEERFALDGKWDLGIGLWTEVAFICQDEPVAAFSWRRSVVLGIDYTFELGNGLYLLAEQFYSQSAKSLPGIGSDGISFSALMARYPFGLLDNLSAIFYFDWRQNQLYSFANWQRTYDKWQFNVMLFWNPRQTQLIQAPSASTMLGGQGFQLMVVLNI